MAADRIPILFDTDIGSDIDDAVALAYLLRQKRGELLGITTVTGDTKQRAALAEVVCRADGREDVPIYAGLTGPLLFGPGQPNVPQYEAVKDQPHRTDYGPPAEAIDFLRRTIRARPGEITLLAVGPLTNISALFAADPEIPTLLKRVVLMCGVFTGRHGHGPGRTEWNAIVDPVATALVFKHAAPGTLTSIGLEVTEKCVLPADECREKFAAAGGPLGIVAKMAEVWFRSVNRITFHDPLAAACVFEPDICGYGPGKAEIVLHEGPLAGMTLWKPGETGPHRVAYTVQPDAFFAHYFGTIDGGG